MGNSRVSGRISDRVHDLLREEILQGVRPPGERLVELELARGLNVSQAPVREALRRLAADGLVLQFPRRGSFVASISVEEAKQAYRVRAVLEEFAASEVAKQPAEALVKLLRSDIELMREAARSGDSSGVVEADVGFHRHVWEATGIPLLARMWGLTETSMRSFTTVSNRLYYTDLTQIAENHVALVDAIEDGAPAIAGVLFREHVLSIWKRMGTPLTS